jgi:dihydroorotase
VALTVLHQSHTVPLIRVIEMLTTGPARAFSLPSGTLAVGLPADVTVFDPASEWTVDPQHFKSKSRNTPFAGWKLRGRVVETLIAGRRTLG